MNIVIEARHMDITDALREYIENKASKLNRLFDRIQTIEVTLEMEADKPSTEIIVSVSRKTFVATHRNDDMYACIDQCLHKLSEQLRRHKEKIRDHQASSHHGESAE